MPTWLRSLVGILAGGAEAYAGGMDWRHVLAGLAVAGLGIVSHLTSTSGTPVAGTTRRIG